MARKCSWTAKPPHRTRASIESGSREPGAPRNRFPALLDDPHRPPKRCSGRETGLPFRVFSLSHPRLSGHGWIEMNDGTNDLALLRRYAESGCEEAFATLVARHIHYVYSVARRECPATHQAE